ncbi:MAG TPA: DUF805 domain-containing protein [Anaerovoracaceae bacterium]|nr:DUF805 domain-containing protein [Anaerovoracaceae bacterium]
MSMIYWWKHAYENAFNLSGRANRAELWSFHIGNLIVFAILFAAQIMMPSIRGLLYFSPTTVFAALIIIPSFAVSTRRFHDRGHSILWNLWVFIPYIGIFFMIALWILASDRGNNKYGPEPLPMAKMTQAIQ